MYLFNNTNMECDVDFSCRTADCFSQDEVKNLTFRLKLPQTDDVVANVKIKQFASHLSAKNKRFLAEDYDLFWAMESNDADTLEIATTTQNFKKCSAEFQNAIKENDVFYIESLWVAKAYRNSGVGSAILKHLAQWLGAFSRNKHPLLILIPAPYEIDRMKYPKEYNIAANKLQEFYKNNGFHFMMDTYDAMYLIG